MLKGFFFSFERRGSAAIKEFRHAHQDNPYLKGTLKIGGTEMSLLRELEERYSGLTQYDEHGLRPRESS